MREYLNLQKFDRERRISCNKIQTIRWIYIMFNEMIDENFLLLDESELKHMLECWSSQLAKFELLGMLRSRFVNAVMLSRWKDSWRSLSSADYKWLSVRCIMRTQPAGTTMLLVALLTLSFQSAQVCRFTFLISSTEKKKRERKKYFVLQW